MEDATYQQAARAAKKWLDGHFTTRVEWRLLNNLLRAANRMRELAAANEQLAADVITARDRAIQERDELREKLSQAAYRDAAKDRGSERSCEDRDRLRAELDQAIRERDRLRERLDAVLGDARPAPEALQVGRFWHVPDDEPAGTARATVDVSAGGRKIGALEVEADVFVRLGSVRTVPKEPARWGDRRRAASDQ